MKRIDIQVNGGAGLLFNSIKNIDEFIKIELNHLKYGKTFIIPTFITDSNENLAKFVNIVLQRIALNEKKYKIGNTEIILPKLWGIHIEGPFITNKGTHNEKYLRDFNEKNVNEIIEILKPLGKLPIYFTLAPELIDNKIQLLEKLKNELNITISAGHTKITRKEFEKFQNTLGENKIKMISHLHNAMLEGHFTGDIEGIPSYLAENDYDGYFGFITDGQHTKNGELIPTLLNYSNNICLVSDSAAPACCKITNENNLYEMGGSVSVVEQKNGELPSFFWTDFTINPNEKAKNASLNELYEMYIKGEGGRKTLAGSAVHLDQIIYFLNHFDIEKEIEKSKANKKTAKFFEKGLQKNNLKEADIRQFILENIEKMVFDNPVKALNIDKGIHNYDITNGKLYKNGKLFIEFTNDINKFMEQGDNNQEELKNKLLKYLDAKYINKN